LDNATTAKGGETVLTPQLRPLFEVPLADIVALALAISAIFLYVQSAYNRQEYEMQLRQRSSAYRWLDGAFSSSLLPVALGMAAGLRDISSLLMLLALGFVAHILGWQFERQLAAGQTEDAGRSFILMAVCSLAAWLAVGVYLLATLLLDGGVVWSLLVAYGLTLTLVLLYGWLLRQYRQGRGRWRQYVYLETTLTILGFIIKSLLAWQLFAATL
jgi:hypothetical protein